LKPSRGLVSPGPYGVDGAGLATHGVLTRTVRDAAAFLDVLAHPWPGDTFTARRRAAPSGRPLRVGLLLDPVIAADAPVHPACAGVARATAALLGELGHDVVEIPPPFAAERWRSEEHTSELQSRENLVCRLLVEKKKLFTDQITL